VGALRRIKSYLDYGVFQPKNASRKYEGWVTANEAFSAVIECAGSFGLFESIWF